MDVMVGIKVDRAHPGGGRVSQEVAEKSKRNLLEARSTASVDNEVPSPGG